MMIMLCSQPSFSRTSELTGRRAANHRSTFQVYAARECQKCVAFCH